MYTAIMVNSPETTPAFFNQGGIWYNMAQEHCPVHTLVNNTQDIHKAIRFDTKEEAEKHVSDWFVEGAYEVVGL